MSLHRASTRHARQRGFSLIEILISLVITAFGLLGLASFATKATALSVDASQRARASALLNDMTSRLANNKANAASYVVDGAVYGAAELTCTGAVGSPARDLCEWGNLLAGANDKQGSGTNAAFLGYRGCVTRPTLEPVYVITVAWGSLTPGVPPADLCAKGAFGTDDTLRRVIRSQVRIANLTA